MRPCEIDDLAGSARHVPIWCNNLDKLDLNNFYGFIEAYVKCPSNIMRPFLPYRDKNNTLLVQDLSTHTIKGIRFF